MTKIKVDAVGFDNCDLQTFIEYIINTLKCYLYGEDLFVVTDALQECNSFKDAFDYASKYIVFSDRACKELSVVFNCPEIYNPSTDFVKIRMIYPDEYTVDAFVKRVSHVLNTKVNDVIAQRFQDDVANLTDIKDILEIAQNYVVFSEDTLRDIINGFDTIS